MKTKKQKFIPFEDVKAQLLKRSKFKAEYDALEEKFALIAAFIRLRKKTHLSQEDIAARMGTTQSVVARIESGKTSPSLKTLYRYAQAAGARPVISFSPVL